MGRLASLTVIGIFAAMAFTASPLYADGGIEKRMENQEQRIQQGVNSGQLTPKEASKLEAEQAKIRQSEEKMKADGKLTKRERKKLNKQQDKASHHIAKLKHNKKKAGAN